MKTEADRLFAEEAVLKEVNKRHKANVDAIKARAIEDYKAGRGGQVRSPLFGNKAGYITVKEGKPAETVREFQMVDAQVLTDWMEENPPSFESLDCFAADHLELFAEWHFRQTGEVPEGCTVLEYETPPKEPTATFVVRENEIIPRLLEDSELRAELFGGSDITPLLEGGDEE